MERAISVTCCSKWIWLETLPTSEATGGWRLSAFPQNYAAKARHALKNGCDCRANDIGQAFRDVFRKHISSKWRSTPLGISGGWAAACGTDLT